MTTLANIQTLRMETCQYWMRFAESQTLGQLAEQYVLRWLQNQGFIARHTAQHKHQGDVTATDTTTGEIIRVEVKASRRDGDGRFNFCIRKKGKTSAYHSDFVVLMAVDGYHKIYRYIVPVAHLDGVTSLKISSHPTKYSGKFAPFLVRDDAISLEDIRTTYELIGD